MRIDRLLLSLSLPLAALASACSNPSADAPAHASDPTALVLQIAAQYSQYGRVDDTPRFAPIACAVPSRSSDEPMVSRSDDTGTHGQKLFYLYARNGADYLTATASPAAYRAAPAGSLPPLPGGNDLRQVLVKESFLPPESVSAKPIPKDLFIMMQFPAATPNTDGGWVYAVVSPDHQTAKESGQIQSCMKCHDAAPHGHLFGLSPSQ